MKWCQHGWGVVCLIGDLRGAALHKVEQLLDVHGGGPLDGHIEGALPVSIRIVRIHLNTLSRKPELIKVNACILLPQPAVAKCQSCPCQYQPF